MKKGFTVDELMADEDIAKLAIAIKKQSEDKHVRVYDMISEGVKMQEWISKIQSISILMDLEILSKCVRNSIKDKHVQTRLLELIDLIGKNPNADNDTREERQALVYSFLLSSISSLTINDQV